MFISNPFFGPSIIIIFLNFGQSYIVYLGSHSHGLNPSAVDLQLATQTHYNLLGSVLGR